VGLLIAICTLLLLALIVLVVTAPLRRAEQQRLDPQHAQDSAAREIDAERTLRRDELEAAREAKYREIRDAEMDHRTGKLSAEDHRALDAELRAEALEILDSLQRLGEGGEPGHAAKDGAPGASA
jgi:flagellar biosynthesis/type III secretory pathway M-ring protein FliF/YscJ